MELTRDQLAAMIPNNNDVDAWHEALVDILPQYDINTKQRIAGFIAQCAHESAEFTRLEENLNYSAKALRSVFGRYFGPGKRDADEYHRQPEMIANYVYMDEFRKYKMGNIYEGDGWLFRGRGLKQLTGRDNYTAFGDTWGLTAEEAVAYVETPTGAVASACWFWKNANCNDYADNGDIVGLSKRINGGTIGLEDRVRRWNHALEVLGMDPADLAIEEEDEDEILDDIGVLRKGSRGDGVRMMQEALGIVGADGIFGPGTEAVLKRWQGENGLTADGIAGPATFSVLFD